MTIHAPTETENMTVDNITVMNAKVSKAFIFDLPKIIANNTILSKSIWTKEIKILSQWFFLAKYNTMEERNQDAKNFSKSHKKEWFFAEELPKWYQIPENAGTFEFEWRYFLILNAYNQQMETDDDFSINWVVFDMPAYNLVHTIKDAVKDLI